MKTWWDIGKESVPTNSLGLQGFIAELAPTLHGTTPMRLLEPEYTCTYKGNSENGQGEAFEVLVLFVQYF